MSTPTDTTTKPSDTTTVDDDETLNELVSYLLDYNYFVYSYTELRYVVRRHDAGVDDRRKVVHTDVMVHQEDYCTNDEKKASLASSSSWWKFWASDTTLDQVEFDQPELIITDKSSIQKPTQNRNLKHPVTAAALKLFVEKNRKYLVLDNGGSGTHQFNTDWRDFGKPVQGWFGRTSEYMPDKETEKERLWFQQKLQEQVEWDVEIIDYDDTYLKGDKEGLVHGLILNKKQKCFCVVFRGTVGNKFDGFLELGTAWQNNFNYELSDDGKYGEGARIHKGFGDYLFGKRGCDGENHTYLYRIIASVNNAFKKYSEDSSDYKLYITGHSLGGGLASLLGFHIARLKEMNDKSVQYLPMKIKVVTFAAPMAGNKEHNVQYKRLEETGFLRHLRITNDGDVVPTQPPKIPFVVYGDPSNFVQTGVNLVLSSNAKSYIKSNNTVTTFRSQLSLRNASTFHSLPEFEKRWGPYNPANPANPLEGTPDYNQDFRPLTLKEFYEKGDDVID